METENLFVDKKKLLMPPLIVVVGSSNTDMVIKAECLPAPGETSIAEKEEAGNY